MKKISSILLGLLFIAGSLFSSDEPDYVHQFVGHHLIASYGECELASLTDIPELEKALVEAINASGATILSSTKHVFPPNGFTMVFLLSESHASIHTYPEYGACFVDLFTCGDRCDAAAFDQVLVDYLKPGKVSRRMLLRNDQSQDE